MISTVGIIGAGTMGNGIAQACAVAGLRAIMVDVSEAAVAKGLATVAKSLDRLVSKDKMSEADKTAALSRIQGSTQYEDLRSAQLVIEAATENQGLKVKILQQLDAMLAPDVEAEERQIERDLMREIKRLQAQVSDLQQQMRRLEERSSRSRADSV